MNFLCSAACVLVLGADGSVAERLDPGLPAADPVAAARAPAAGTPRASISARRKTVVGELRRMWRADALTREEYTAHRDEYASAKKLARRLPGRRRVEMAGYLRVLEGIAARGSLTVSRVPGLWLGLRRNRQWWATGPLLLGGRRVSFKGSEIVWQYFPGQGLQFHPLANFGKLNGLWQGKVYDDRLAVLLDELLDIAVERGGAIAWEYDFHFGGGAPPWVSGLAQGTALQALARAAIRLQRKDEVLPIAERGLGIFELPPPVGVRKVVPGGVHYLLYSHSPRLHVLNGFVQALVGLFDFAKYANDDRARQLFARGESAARAEVPRFDTGFWSLYSRGAVTRESDLSYHRLTRGFLGGLCERTLADTYCDAQARFVAYESEPPQIELITRRARGATTAPLRFRISKISTVTVKVARGTRAVFARTLRLPYGTRSLAWRVPRRRGVYTWRVRAVDLAGNVASRAGEIEVLKPKRRRT